MLLNVLQGAADGFVVTDVEHQTGTFDAVVLQRFGDALRTRRRGCSADHDCALTTQLKGNGLADPAARASYQRHLTLQIHSILLVQANASRVAAKASGVSRL